MRKVYFSSFLLFFICFTPFLLQAQSPTLVINEVDADNPSTDDQEFVELYDGGVGSTPLDGYVLVFYNGNGDTSYKSVDLDGHSTNAQGYFVLGAATVPSVDLVIGTTNIIQNGADAVALYQANASDFPSSSPISTENLIDALVYDTNDSDDAELLVLLNPGQTQINEGGSGDKDNHSNQRSPNGSGGSRNTSSYIQAIPTPGAPNVGTSDSQAPEIIAFLPENGQTEVPSNTFFEFTFDEEVIKGNGEILIKNLSDEIFASIDVNSSDVVISGTNVRFSLLSNLNLSTTYYVELTAGTFTDLSGNEFVGQSGTAFWQFTTEALPSPSLVTSITALDLGSANINQPSSIFSYFLSATKLRSDVLVEVNLPFSLSLDGETFTQNLNISKASLTADQEIFVRFTSSLEGSFSESISHSTEGVLPLTLSLSATVNNPFQTDFNTCDLTAINWTSYSFEGADQNWECTTYGIDGSMGVQMNGYSGGALLNEDWLITSAMDLSSFDYPLLSFASVTKFTGPGLKLLVSTDYSGSGDPSLANWEELNGKFPALNSDSWTYSNAINLGNYKSSATYLAFVYTSSPELGAARWTLDNFSIENSLTPPPASLLVAFDPLTNYDFGVIESDAISSAKELKFNASDLTSSLQLIASSYFELSKDNNTFSNELTFGLEELSLEQSIFVRFNPQGQTVKAALGQIQFLSEGIDENFGNYTASTVDLPITLDVVSWNLEWFGSTMSGRGPSDVNEQMENVKKILEQISADIYAVQEVSDEALLDEMLAQMPNYARVCSDYFSYYFEGNDDPATNPAQKLCFIYNTQTVNITDSRALFAGLFEDIHSGATTLPDYPTDPKKLWASGRLPHLISAEVNIGGVIKNIDLINLHAKAGSDQSSWERRTYDVQLLKDSLDANYGENNLIILGDYNDDVNESINPGAVTPYQIFVDDTENYQIATQSLSSRGFQSTINYNNVIDNIAVSDELFNQLYANSERIIIPIDWVTDYEYTTSDHLPVLTRIELSNSAPVWVGSVNNQQSPEKEDLNLSLTNISVKDPDVGDSFSISAGLVNGEELPTWLSFDAISLTFQGTPMNEDVGVYTIELVATDQSQLSSSTTFQLEVTNVNDAPVLVGTISEQTACIRSPFELQLEEGLFSDPDVDDQLIYSATLSNGENLPNWLQFDAISKSFAGMPSRKDVGLLDVIVKATDNGGAYAEVHFPLTVSKFKSNCRKKPQSKLVRLFPNPTSSRLNIRLPEEWISTTEVKVIRLKSGRELTHLVPVFQQSDSLLRLDLSRLLRGVYIIQLITPEGTNHYRINKK
ncbi:putative Ig domain-containing protein [Xanthovirga aplysinae]|uniref:putative Ig domain-containing protein n=1 Tax=Xanthovirga aplysinae TaxID=2529853 RepID=UPI0012BC1587|nr:putative Ig domain-containing protein [Xanthovirga aplysinae]MTI31798.1 T9SS type A sorting domain-containing protein [Xanthovirga aplysinae]